VVAPKDGGALIWGAAAAVPGTDVRAITLRLTDQALLEKLGAQVGAQLRAVNFATYHAPPDDDMTPLHTRALANPGGAAAGRLPGNSPYAATMVLAAQTGEVVGLLDARLGGAEFLAATHSFDWILGTTAIIVAAIAGLLGVLYGRWLARPVVALRELAERIGRGDFSTALPAVAPLEVGALARSMDEMRRNLVDLTDTLRRREAEAQTVLSGVIEGVYAVDHERRIRYANAQVARLLGRPAGEIVGQFCGDVLQPQRVNGERPCEHNCPIIAARASPQASLREMLCLADGSTRSAIVLSAPPVQGVQVQILRDETDLEAARRARDSVLGNISHEFRTPLAAQLASIELLREGLSDMPVEAQRELLANVERGVLRLMRLIDNLLESVRIEAGQHSIRQQPVDLAEVIADARDLIEPLLRQRQLSIELDESGIGAIVRGDAQRLGQVFVNLIANAAKFAPEGSTIRIGGQRSGTHCEVWVEDEGPGVQHGASDSIFERFQRGADSEPDAPGLGLGLWIVKSIIERHGGTIRMQRTPDQRTRFVLSLPQQPEDAF
jgi:signal transduction histidine kinase